jgi:hypothetical protein
MAGCCTEGRTGSRQWADTEEPEGQHDRQEKREERHRVDASNRLAGRPPRLRRTIHILVKGGTIRPSIRAII